MAGRSRFPVGSNVPVLQSIRMGLVALPLCLWLAACGGVNIGQVFSGDTGSDTSSDDGDGGGDGDPQSGPSVSPPDESILLPGSPSVVTAGPATGAADVDAQTSLAVVFSESVQQSTLAEGVSLVDAIDSAIAIDQVGLFSSGRLAVFTPSTALAVGSYELKVTTAILDLDGNPLAAAATVSSFTVGAPISPSVVLVHPSDTSVNEPVSTDVLVLFSKPVDPTTLSLGISVTENGTIKGFSLLEPLGGDRMARFVPDAAFAASASVAVQVTNQITDTEIETHPLDAPVLAAFTAMDLLAPTALVQQSAPTGFINAASLVAFDMDVAIDTATVAAGDEVHLIFHEESSSDFIAFQQNVAAPVATPVSFTGLDLRDLGVAVLDEGNIAVSAYMRRPGGATTPTLLGETIIQDTLPPSLLSLGPPAGPTASTFLVEGRDTGIHGTSTEPVGGISVSVPARPELDVSTLEVLGTKFTPTNFFRSVPLGSEAVDPQRLGLLTAPLAFQVTLTDAAGNQGASISATLHQRGAVTGSASGAVTVEAYDVETLAVLPNVTVVLHPATGAASIALTDSQGRAMFSDPGAQTFTVTVVADTYDLVSLADTTARFLSLPVARSASLSATVSGSVSGSTGTPFFGLSGLLDEAGASVVIGDPLFKSFGGRSVRPSRPFQLSVADVNTLTGTLLRYRATGTEAPLGAGTTISWNPSLAATLSPSQKQFVFFTADHLDTLDDSPGYALEAAGGTAITPVAAGGSASSLVTMDGPLRGVPGNLVVGGGVDAELMDPANAPFWPSGEYALDPLAAGTDGVAAVTGPFVSHQVNAVDATGSSIARIRADATMQALFALSLPLPLVPLITDAVGNSPASVSFQNSLPVARVGGALELNGVDATGLYRVTLADTATRSWVLYATQPAVKTDAVRTLALPDLAVLGLTGLLDSGNHTMRVEAFTMLFLPVGEEDPFFATPFDDSAFHFTDLRRFHFGYASSPTLTF